MTIPALLHMQLWFIASKLILTKYISQILQIYLR